MSTNEPAAETSANSDAPSASTVETTEVTTPSATTPPETGEAQTSAGSSAGELEKWIANSRKNEKTAKANKAELDKVKGEHQTMLDNLAKALGLKQDEAPDLGKLTAQLALKEDESKQVSDKLRQKDVQLAIYRLGTNNGGDPVSLVDSQTFMTAVADLDPTAKTFESELTEAIKAAVKANPRFAAQHAAPRPPAKSGGDFNGAPGEGQPITQEQLSRMSPDEITKAFQAGKLQHLM